MIYLVSFAVPTILTLVLLPVLVVDSQSRRRSQARKPAEERGFALLQAWLGPEQAEQWTSQRAFEVLGCDTGTRYRITCGTAMNVHQLDQTGRSVARWCFVPEGDLVTGDILLAQKIALETMERQVLKLGNTQASCLRVQPLR
jgi:hypothetical protein